MVIRTRAISGVIAAAGFWWVCAAHAAWEAVPSFNVRAELQDNPRLQPDGTIDDTSAATVLAAEIDLSSFNERGFIEFRPSAEVNKFADDGDEALEGTDWLFTSQGEYRWAVTTIGFNGEYQKQRVIRSELPDIADPDFEDDVDDPDSIDIDSGRLLFIDQYQNRSILRPYLRFQLSERSTIRLETGLTSVSYSGGSNVSRTGFDNRSLRAAVSRRANDRTTVTATLEANSFEADANGNQTDSVGILGALDRRLNDLWRFSLTAGVGRSDYTFDDDNGRIDNAELDYSFGIRTRRVTERTRLELRLQHTLDPSSTGFLVKRNQARLFVTYDITQRLSMRTGIRLEDRETVGNVARLNDRTYFRTEFSLGWAIRPTWRISGGYNYTDQEFVNQDTGSRASGTLWIGIGYQGLSRPGAP